MNVKMKVDYRGVLTGENFIRAGGVVDLPDSAAERLIHEGYAQATDEAVSQAGQAAQAEDARLLVSLTDVKGVNDKLADEMVKAGIMNAFDLAHASKAYLASHVSGIGEKTADRFIKAAYDAVYSEA